MEGELGEAPGGSVVPSLEDVLSKDQVSWAQCLLEASFFESCFSPKSCFSPQGEVQTSGVAGFPDLGAVCPSPLLSDQLKILHNWSTRVAKRAEEAVSTSVSSGSEACMSTAELDKVGSTLTESGDDSRKRKAPSEDQCDGSLTEEKNSSLKKMKAKGTKRPREPRYAIKTRSDVDIMEDGYKWRKYGQKPVKSSPHPRNYYRCTTANCPVRKRVERCTEDTGLVITSYEGTHSHPKVIQQKNPQAPSNDFDHDLSRLLDPVRRPGATSANLSVPPFPPVPNLDQFWGSPLNFPGWARQQQVPPSAHDNLGLIMAYQLVKLQWELQARTQQFLDFNSQTAAADAFSDPEMVNSFTNGQQFPFPLGSSLLRKRASAFRNGGPGPLDLQSIAKMQHLTAAQQLMAAGRPHAGHDLDDSGLDQAPA